MAFSWLKVATTAFTFKTLLRHYAKWALTPRSDGTFSSTIIYSSHTSTYLHIYSGAPGEAGGWLVFPVPVSPLLRSSRGSRLLQLGGLLEMQVCICIGYYIFYPACKISSHSQSPGRASSCPPTRWTARRTGRAATAARASPRTPSGS